MAQIGSWGNVLVFSTDDKRILTFSDFKRKISTQWAKHDRIGQKSSVEFLRADLQQVTFTVVLDASLGIRPRWILENLEKQVEYGNINPLVIGGKRVGQKEWRITELSEAWEIVLSKGELARAKLEVTMEEYL